MENNNAHRSSGILEAMPTLNIVLNLSALFILLLTGCGSKFSGDEKNKGYNLTSPDDSIILPDTLQEISGLTGINSTSFACIQDENGIIFIYDMIKNEITNYCNFSKKGDFEGIARVNKSMFVLRSDGVIFEVSDFESTDFETEKYETKIPSNDNEGLCYDPDNNRLLIACKGKIGKKDENKDKRFIYAFNLKTKKLSEEPVFSFDLKTIRHFATKNKINLPTTKKKKGDKKEPILKFRTSEICIQPLTKKLFLLSADDHLLFIFNMKGKIERIEKINPDMFNQAEGLTFFENGDMLISNEGQDKYPTLLKFNYKNN
jgi:hypothetical protein